MEHAKGTHMNVASPLQLALAAVQYWTFGELHHVFHRLPARLRRRSSVDKIHVWLVGGGDRCRRETLSQAEAAVDTLRHDEEEVGMDQATRERLMQQHVFVYARTAPPVEYVN